MSNLQKLMTADQAVEQVADGACIALGGWVFNSQPMALVKALLNQGAGDLRLLPAPGSIAPDILIGAGRVAETFCIFISFEEFGLAPNFRRQAEAQALRVLELDGPALAAGLRAAICDLPYGLIPDLATDLPRVNPDYYRPVPREPGQRPLLSVPPIRPDVCLLHAQQGDIYGNVQFLGPPFFDVMLAQASRRVIVSVDRIVDTATLSQASHLTKLPCVMVDAVVEAPQGAYPTASPSLYAADETELKRYLKACRTPDAFASYVDAFISSKRD
ncbi:MAG: CoA transferase subunit A [Pigmentiphaga sp.]